MKCTENNPEKPALPKYDDLKKLFGETINVTCETDEQHAPQSFGLMAGTYSVTRDKEEDNEAVVTVFAKDYIKAYADGKHTNAGDDAATVKLFCDEDGEWYSENQELHITEHLLRTVRQNLQRPLRLERNSRLRIFLHPRARAAVTAIRPGINSRLDML